MSLSTLLKSLGTKAKAEGSAFVKVAEADLQAIEAKGRIVALDATTKVKNEVADELEKEVTRVHVDLGAVKTRFDNILAKL